MRWFICLFVAVACVTPAFAVDGSGTSKTETRELPAAHALDVGGAFDVEITVGTPQKVEITADDNLLPLIETKVADGVLEVSHKETISTKSGMKLTLTLADLSSVKLSGAGNVKISGVANSALAIELSGAANVSAAGKTKELKVDMSGAGKATLGELACENATLDVSGAGSMDVTVSGKLTAKVSGVGSVTYGGNPKTVEKDVTGVGSVAPR